MTETTGPASAGPGGRGVFVSYRRGETTGHARALHERLSQRFGTSRVFMDVDSIDPGADFVTMIEQAISSCGVMVVLIGRDWATGAGEGNRILDDPNDFVRLELETALARGIAVIPILVERTRMPTSRELPEALWPLLRRNALELENARWSFDVDRLEKAIERLTVASPASQPPQVAPPPPPPAAPPLSVPPPAVPPQAGSLGVATQATSWAPAAPVPPPWPATGAPPPPPAQQRPEYPQVAQGVPVGQAAPPPGATTGPLGAYVATPGPAGPWAQPPAGAPPTAMPPGGSPWPGQPPPASPAPRKGRGPLYAAAAAVVVVAVVAVVLVAVLGGGKGKNSNGPVRTTRVTHATTASPVTRTAPTTNSVPSTTIATSTTTVPASSTTTVPASSTTSPTVPTTTVSAVPTLVSSSEALISLVPRAVSAKAVCGFVLSPDVGAAAEVDCDNMTGAAPSYVHYYLFASAKALQNGYSDFLSVANTHEQAGSCGNFSTFRPCETSYYASSEGTLKGRVLEFYYSSNSQAHVAHLAWTLPSRDLLIDIEGTSGKGLLSWWAQIPPVWAALSSSAAHAPSIPPVLAAHLMSLIPKSIVSNADGTCYMEVSPGFASNVEVYCGGLSGVASSIAYYLYGSVSSLHKEYGDFLSQFAGTTENSGNCGNFTSFSACETAYGPGHTTIGRIVEYRYQPSGQTKKPDLTWTLDSHLLLMDMQGPNGKNLVQWWAKLPIRWANVAG
ncbi:MAG TPA: TIR domain-containing protein [Acidimicrobiales bacterium]|nr:TIR domain-containing protein [Acidimicrobiales bacterium]